ncbi:unnamed protein product, partial [marine sediment metagenome]
QESLISPSDLKRKIPHYLKPEMAELTHLYKIYLDRIKEDNLIDFGGLLYNIIDILKKEPLILKELQKKYPHIIVDDVERRLKEIIIDITENFQQQFPQRLLQ